MAHRFTSFATVVAISAATIAQARAQGAPSQSPVAPALPSPLPTPSPPAAQTPLLPQAPPVAQAPPFTQAPPTAQRSLDTIAALAPPGATPSVPAEPSSQPSTEGGVSVRESAPFTLSPNPIVTARGLREQRATPTARGGPGDPASVAAGAGGFGLSSHDKQWQIRFRALVQADGRFWFDDTQRRQTDTFLIRRAQPYIEGSLPHGVSFLLNPDFGGGTTTLQDAYVGLDLDPALRLRLGKFRPPFGLERLQPTSNLSFVEFGLPSLLTPNRDVGAMVHGDLFKGIFGYAAGAFNGAADNGSGDLDTDSEKEFVGRAYFRPFLPIPDEVLGRLFVGVATTFGRVYGNPSNPAVTNPAATPAYKTPGQINDFTYINAASGVLPDYSTTVVANGPHNRYGVYVYEALARFSLLGEYYLSDQEVGRAGKGNIWVHNRAYQLQATLVVFGGNASYDFVRVETPFDAALGHFGALELASRVGHLDIDSDVFPNFASPSGSVRGATEVTLGANWYWSDNAKLVVNWDHTEFQGGAKTPSELAIAHREAENLLLLRAQVVY